MSAIAFADARSGNGKPIRLIEGFGADLPTLKAWIAAQRPAIRANASRFIAMTNVLGCEFGFTIF